jgi:hypothetical protein
MVPLPVAIAKKIPHIVHEFGWDSVEEFIVQIAGTAETYAALNTMYLPLGFHVCKKYLWLLQAMYGPTHHHPLKLSGIVKEDKEAVSTDLLVMFVFVAPMRNNSGQHINVAFAAGNMVSVNMIFSLPYLESTGSVVDLNDNIVVMSKVGHSQFPIGYRVSQCSVPKVEFESSNKNKQATNTRYKGVRNELNGIKALVQYAHVDVIPSAILYLVDALCRPMYQS